MEGDRDRRLPPDRRSKFDLLFQLGGEGRVLGSPARESIRKVRLNTHTLSIYTHTQTKHVYANVFSSHWKNLKPES